MKKNVLKMGLLALAVALVMAACADPNANKDSGNKNPTIIRLYLDGPAEETLTAADAFHLTVGEEILTPVNYPGAVTGFNPGTGPDNKYPYVRAILSGGQVQDAKMTVVPGYSYADSTKDANINGGNWTPWDSGTGNSTTKYWSAGYTDKGKHTLYADVPGQIDYITPETFQNDRRNVLMIKPGEATGTASVISRAKTDKKVLWSGTITLDNAPAAGSATSSTAIPLGMIQGTTQTQLYVDILLYNASQNYMDAMTIFTGSMNAYIEMDLSTSSAINRTTGMYYYTPKKRGFNDKWKFDNVHNATYYKTDNSNIKKVSLKPGINEIYLSNFSRTQFHDQLN